MYDLHLAETEAKFADIIWENEPVKSPELVKIAEKELNWNKSTTYTVLRKLCHKRLFKNENTIVSAVIKKPEYLALKSVKTVYKLYNGSLPAFISAFTSKHHLTKEEKQQLIKIMEEIPVDD